MTPAASPLLTILSQKKAEAQLQFEKKHTFAKEWLQSQGLTVEKLRVHSAKLLSAGTLGSALLLTAPHLPLLATKSADISVTLHSKMQSFMDTLLRLDGPVADVALETEITENIKRFYGVSAVFELDHNRIPSNAGLMGLEQHLYRFAEDSLSQHNAHQEAGIAPARGAFGYFTEEGKSWKEMEAQERYYIVLQTFLIPTWNTDWNQLKKWYKFRKFVVINPDNGRAVVAVLGDSGPAVWTGKQFGGSPEVMAELGWYPTKTKGKTIVLFLDDPGNQIPLGPLSLKEAP